METVMQQSKVDAVDGAAPHVRIETPCGVTIEISAPLNSDWRAQGGPIRRGGDGGGACGERGPEFYLPLPGGRLIPVRG
jgi:hypothetical protein